MEVPASALPAVAAWLSRAGTRGLSFPCGRCASREGLFRLGLGGRSRLALCLALCHVNPLHVVVTAAAPKRKLLLSRGGNGGLAKLSN